MPVVAAAAATVVRIRAESSFEGRYRKTRLAPELVYPSLFRARHGCAVLVVYFPSLGQHHLKNEKQGDKN